MQLSELLLPFATYFSEFLGTYWIVFVASILLISEEDYGSNEFWRPTAIAFATVAATYATSAVSGSHLNPALSLAYGLTRKMYWGRVWAYIIIQVVAGIAASATVVAMMNKRLPEVTPKASYSFADAAVVEGIYSFMLCFVSLNVLASMHTNPRGARNQFFALAIGFVMIAGNYPASQISGGFINPAITIGVVVMGPLSGEYLKSFLIAAAQVAGSFAAAVFFFLIRPEELAALGLGVGGSTGLSCSRLCGAVKALNFCGNRNLNQKEEQEDGDSNSEDDIEVNATSRKYVSPWPARFLAETVGTYLVVLTYGLCSVITSKSSRLQSHEHKALMLLNAEFASTSSNSTSGTASDFRSSGDAMLSTPMSTGAAVLSMTYALGAVSGAQFNPAVTLAVMLSSRDPYVWAEAPSRILSQAVGAVAAGVTIIAIYADGQHADQKTLPWLGPSDGYSWLQVTTCEMFFTAVMAYVYLCMMTVDSPRYPKAASTTSFDHGLAVGLCIMAGGWVIELVSGGVMNPAIALGIVTADVINNWPLRYFSASMHALLQYVGWQCAGGTIASFAFWLVHPLLYKPDPLLAK